jgi:hypothetical protein
MPKHKPTPNKEPFKNTGSIILLHWGLVDLVKYFTATAASIGQHPEEAAEEADLLFYELHKEQLVKDFKNEP